MINETHFENDFIIKYFVDILQYQQLEPNVFNSDLMLIPSIVKQFIYENNTLLCDTLIKKDFQSNKVKFWDSLLKELSNEIHSKFNVAIFLNPNNTSKFKFMGEEFILYVPFEDSHDNKNIFNVMGQPVFKIQNKHGNLTIIPDVGTFVNGIMTSYLQLKFNAKGQNSDKARGQIIGDYIDTIHAVVYPEVINSGIIVQDKVKAQIVSNKLKYFHSPLHAIAMDESSAYVLRGMGRFFDAVFELAKSGKANDKDLKDEIRNNFLTDAVYVKEQQYDSLTKAKRFLFNTYNKNAIQNEILIYNFVQYERVSEHSNGVKKVTFKNTVPTLSFPRPNQKYGVDKAIAEVIKKYDNESNPNYEIEQLEKKLDNQGINFEVKKRALEKRKSYRNNQKIYSLLLQYAAGFGKTYILCWLAMQLKDLLEKKTTNHLFDKILIISDRVDLRDQVDISMRNMNIDKSLFREAQDKAELRSCLTDSSTRVIIVNIQKFPFVKDILTVEEMELLADKRIAFLIDEIHRSNSGVQHKEMTNIFDDIADSIGVTSNTKKNLIIGLTATPTDENLARFGEYQGCLEDIKWMPFDTYTMTEAINDGFVLDPTKNKISLRTIFQYEAIVDGDKKRMPSIQEEYEMDDRIVYVSKHIAKTLLDVTYRKIRKTGKAMLACYSINAAKKYFDQVQIELEELSKLPEYAGQNIGKVYMVYTSGQEEKPAYRLCGLNSEKEVIAAFRSDKNGLMIVVDKLQTGFDEPRLHTLFLDKEISGITCVQTVCRINRTTKHKNDCLVVDYSKNNKNIANINNAFAKYAGVVVSEFNSLSIRDQLFKVYKDISETGYYTKYFDEFVNSDTVEKAIERRDAIDKMLSDDICKELALRNMALFLEYVAKLGLVMNLVELDKKYTDDKLIKFLNEYIQIVKSILKVQGDKLDAVDFWIERFGLVESNNTVTDEFKGTGSSSQKYKPKKSSGFLSIDAIMKRNAEEKENEALIESFSLKIHAVFEKLKEVDNKEGGRVIAKIQDSHNHSDEDIQESFEKLFSKTLRRLKNDPEMNSFVQSIDDMGPLIMEDFLIYLKDKN